MSQIATFNFDGATLRTTTGADGEPWFVAADICAALEIGNTTMALVRLDDDEKGVSSIDTLGGAQHMATVNESGLYSLILGSRKPEAKRFKKWVTAEVLPAIRKTGRYDAQPAPLNPATLSRLQLIEIAMQAEQERLALEHKVEVLEPKAEALDRFMTVTDGSFCLTDAAKALQVPPRKFLVKLQEMGWIYRRPMGSGWLAYQDRIAIGVMEHKVTTGDKSNGTEWSNTQARVTAKGMARLAVLFTDAKVHA